MDNEKDLLGAVTKGIDRMLTENEVQMLITLPEGTEEAKTESPFNNPVLDFFILTKAISGKLTELFNMQIMDETKKEDFLDSLMEIMKQEILED